MIIVIFLSGCVIHSSKIKSNLMIRQLETSIQARLDRFLSHATFSVAFKNLDDGDKIMIDEHENFHAASTRKTHVMIEVFKQASEGKFSLNDSIPVKNSFESIVDSSEFSLDSTDDSQTELYKKIET